MAERSPGTIPGLLQTPAYMTAVMRDVETDLDNLTEQDRAQIADAISVIRKTRQVVTLGMPSIRRPTEKPMRCSTNSGPSTGRPCLPG